MSAAASMGAWFSHTLTLVGVSVGKCGGQPSGISISDLTPSRFPMYNDFLDAMA